MAAEQAAAGDHRGDRRVCAPGDPRRNTARPRSAAPPETLQVTTLGQWQRRATAQGAAHLETNLFECLQKIRSTLLRTGRKSWTFPSSEPIRAAISVGGRIWRWCRRNP